MLHSLKRAGDYIYCWLGGACHPFDDLVKKVTDHSRRIAGRGRPQNPKREGYCGDSLAEFSNLRYLRSQISDLRFISDLKSEI